MSTRFYRLYQRGGPQRRVYLSDFWMKLVRPTHEQPPDIVQFACSMEMSKQDVKSYLEKIYNIDVVKVNLRIAMGKTHRNVKGYVVKDDDTKYAYITLPRGQTFKFPDLYASDAMKSVEEDEKRAADELQKKTDELSRKNKDRPGLPGWFSV